MEPFYPMSVCAEIYPQVAIGDQICAGSVQGKSSCHGDSGGPLMIASNINNTVVGVVSGGPGEKSSCGTYGGYPKRYTSVPAHKEWIKGLVQGEQILEEGNHKRAE